MELTESDPEHPFSEPLAAVSLVCSESVTEYGPKDNVRERVIFHNFHSIKNIPLCWNTNEEPRTTERLVAYSLGLHFGSKKRLKSSKIIDILPVFFEPK